MMDRNSPAFIAHLDQTMAGIRETIERNGYVIVPIIDSDFAYTVGLSERGKPELAAYGAPSRYCARFLEVYAERLVAPGHTVAPFTVTVGSEEDDKHTLTVRPHDLADGDIPLGMVVGLYGPGRPALMVDLMSCKCKGCIADRSTQADA